MVTTTVRLPEELHKRLKEEARKRGMTLNAWILQVLWRPLGKEVG